MALALVTLPLLAGPAIWGAGDRPGRRHVGTAAIGTALATVALAIAAAWQAASWSTEWGTDLQVTLSADGVAGAVAVLVAVVGAAVVAYASVHEEADGLARLLGLLVAFVGVMQLLVLAADLLTLLIAWELSAALSWALIGFDWRRHDDVGRASHAFNATRAGSLGLVIAAGAAFAGTGSLTYESLVQLDGGLLRVAAAGVVFAAVSKSAQLPFAPWLYSAMVGPTPVSALLHSATMVAAGTYALIRLAEPLSDAAWFGPAVVAIGMTTAVAGGVLALCETHAKRILAASTSAQYGLMFVAVGVGAAGAAAVHLVAHGLFKSLLFLAVGVGIHQAGTPDVRQWRLGRQVPRVALTAGVGALALAAVPPIGAAWTKGQIAAAALHTDAALGGLILVAGVLSAAYAARLQFYGFGPGTGARDPNGSKVRLLEQASLAVLATASIALGVLWLPAVAPVVESLTGQPVLHESIAELVVSVVLVTAGVAWGWALTRDVEHARSRSVQWFTAAVGGWFGLPQLTRRVVVDPTLGLAAMLARFDDAVLDAPARGVAVAGARASRVLPRFDDTVVDGAVRGVVAAGRAVSRGLAWWVERGVDGVVAALAAVTERIGALSRLGDDRVVDAAVEGVARAVGATGHQSRRLQSGLAHHYYVIAVVGLAALVAVATFWR